MAKAIALSDIAITHISLVKAGANGKQVIYKSAANEGGYEHTIAIKKNDEEKGVIYGVVYAPDEVDSQGDFATAGEIEKAAYAFMKARNTTNVDVDHSFEPEAAFVAESWIVKGGDSIFPDEPVGSWAVAIKLEDEDLKALAKSGELAGISMAGVAQKNEVEKSGEVGDKPFEEFFAVLVDVISDVWIDISAVIRKDEKGTKMVEDFAKVIKEKLEKATTAAGEGLRKQDEKIEALQAGVQKTETAMKTLKEAHAALSEENKTLSKENKNLLKENKDLAKKIEAQDAAIEKVKIETEEVTKTVKESKQAKDVKKTESKDDKKGTL